MTKTYSRRDFLKAMGMVATGAVAAGLVGCGGSGTQTAATTAAATDGYTTVTKGKLTMISNFYFPPFVSMNDKTGDFEGFDVDLYKAICKKLDLEPNILPSVQFDTIVPTIKQGGKADVSIGAITITDDREKEVDMTEPYMDSNQALVTKANASAKDADALNKDGVTVAVQSGTTGEAWAKENLPKATVKPLDDIIQCLQGVTSGLYDCSVCDLPVARYEIKIAYSGLDVAMEIPTGEQYGLVVSKDNPGLTKAINQALSDLESDGTIDKLEEKWFGEAL